jgi:hypothetical protein
MLELLIVSLATFTVLMALQAILPFKLPGRAMPVIVSGIAFALAAVPPQDHRYVSAAAYAGLVAVIYRFAVTSEAEPAWSLRNVAAALREASRKPKPPARTGPVGNRIPPM